MAPETGDELDLVRLEYFGAGLETELVTGLLQANGIPAVMSGQFDYANKSGHRGVVMVPRERLDEAYRLIREVRGASGEGSPPPRDLRMPWWLRIAFATPLILLAWNVLQGEHAWSRVMDWLHW
jgi:hypothetical protein